MEKILVEKIPIFVFTDKKEVTILGQKFVLIDQKNIPNVSI